MKIIHAHGGGGTCLNAPGSYPEGVNPYPQGILSRTTRTLVYDTSKESSLFIKLKSGLLRLKHLTRSRLTALHNLAGLQACSSLGSLAPRNDVYAFTLAEVLITLGIIGVVAALTMPTLIAVHRKSTVETALEKFYTNMNQAIKLSEVEHGDKSGWNFPANETKEELEKWYNEYFIKYLITNGVKFEDGVDADGRKYDTLTIYFPDGSIDMVTYRGHDHYYCVNGAKFKNRFKSGHDADYIDKEKGRTCFLFGFYPSYPMTGIECISKNYSNRGLEPYMGSSFNCSGADDDTKLLQSGYYAKVLQRNGWNFPKDYPIKF